MSPDRGSSSEVLNIPRYLSLLFAHVPFPSVYPPTIPSAQPSTTHIRPPIHCPSTFRVLPTQPSGHPTHLSTLSPWSGPFIHALLPLPPGHATSILSQSSSQLLLCILQRRRDQKALMTQPLASGVTACHQLKIDRDQDAGLPAAPLTLASLPLLTGSTLHGAERSQIKRAHGTGIRHPRRAGLREEEGAPGLSPSECGEPGALSGGAQRHAGAGGPEIGVLGPQGLARGSGS